MYLFTMLVILHLSARRARSEAWARWAARELSAVYHSSIVRMKLGSERGWAAPEHSQVSERALRALKMQDYQHVKQIHDRVFRTCNTHRLE